MSVTIINDQFPRFAARLGRLENRKPILRKLAEWKVTRLKKNLTSGEKPDGRPFHRVFPWVRAASIDRGRSAKLTNIKPLLNTGQMRNSIAPLSITNDRAVIGGIGKQEEKMRRMVNGIAGEMRVSQHPVKGLYSGIKTSKAGNDYVRVNTPAGWCTRRVNAGFIRIKPRARPFMYFTMKDMSEMNKLLELEVEKAME